MSDIFIEFIDKASLWLLPLLTVLAVWAKINWDTLNNPAKQQSFIRVMGWLREDSFGQLYLRLLGRVMDLMSDWIGDRGQLSQASITVTKQTGFLRRLFGFNPFTTKSYEKCLLLAFMYPVIAFLQAGAVGSEGQVGNLILFDRADAELSLQGSWLLISGMLLFIATSLWIVMHRGGSQQWMVVGGVYLLAALLGYWLWEKESFIEQFFGHIGFFLTLFILLYLGGLLAGLIIYRSFKAAHQEIYNPALAVSFALACVLGVGGLYVLAIVLAAALAISVASMFTVSFANVVTFVFAFTFGFALQNDFSADGAAANDLMVAAAFAFAGIIIVVLQAVQRWSELHGSTRWFWFVYSAFLILISVASLEVHSSSSYMLFILLCLLLPVVNAPMDWLSLSVTRGLLQAVRTGSHSGYRALIWVGVDLLLALFFLFLITAVLVGVAALCNVVVGKTMVDIGCILSNMNADNSNPDHWWIYLMLISTLIPTLFHFALAGGAATLWLPRKWRTQLADGLEGDMHKTFGAWAYLTFTPAVGFFLMPIALLCSLWWLLNTNSAWLASLLLSWAEVLVKLVDSKTVLVCGNLGF